MVVPEGWLMGGGEGSALGDGSLSIPFRFLPSIACHCLGFFLSCLSFPSCSPVGFLLSSQGGFGTKGDFSRGLVPPEKPWEGTRDTSPARAVPGLSPGSRRCLLAGQRGAGCLHTQSKHEDLLPSVSLLLLPPAWPPLREEGAGAFGMK